MKLAKTLESRLLKFWILLLFQISSILCSIFVLHHMFTAKKFRRTLSSHVIIAMLIVSLLSVTVDLSLTLIYLRLGIVHPKLNLFCFFWMYIDFSFYTCGMLLTAWASFERHILVFSVRYFRLSYRMIFVHYVPILICLIYPFIFYNYSILFYSCENDLLDFQRTLCGVPCFKRESYVLNWYDTLMHSVVPSILIVACYMALLIRVIRQKHRLQQQLFSWGKQRQIIIQLLTVTCLCITMNVPLFTIILI
ncbi:unnamed protein product [Rotaria magnacalcarata]|uniref:G-protein coupled receptors family 1 profile domain-containing protein n=1 Tax=Rotaria magnacalcarata TaxID=392030 RepID=A0A819X8H1_9BILA|nr:unnamed protein product [Rotaria magnacalcarata]CAF4138226.1 unnamed protein product [Rotaria magnacalcarata]